MQNAVSLMYAEVLFGGGKWCAVQWKECDLQLAIHLGGSGAWWALGNSWIRGLALLLISWRVLNKSLNTLELCSLQLVVPRLFVVHLYNTVNAGVF